MICLLQEKEFDRVFSIMKESFPTDEYRNYEGQRALLKRKDYSIFVWKEENEIKAFIAVYNLNDFAFVEHLAVDKKFRNGGTGTKLLNGILENGKVVCLEVELPTNDIAKRRIEFYKRNGFFYNEYEYIQPSMGKGRKEISLAIMTTKKMLDEKQFDQIKNKLYKEVYNVQNG